MTAAEVLRAMAESETLADEVLNYLDIGMWDEWDIGLCDGIRAGFGNRELRVAARTAVCAAEYHAEQHA